MLLLFFTDMYKRIVDSSSGARGFVANSGVDSDVESDIAPVRRTLRKRVVVSSQSSGTGSDSNSDDDDSDDVHDSIVQSVSAPVYVVDGLDAHVEGEAKHFGGT